MDVGHRHLVDRLDVTALDARHLVRGLDGVEDLARRLDRQLAQRRRRADVQRPVACRPLPLALGEELERLRERVGVQRRLDLEHLDPGVTQHPAHPPRRVVDLAVAMVHEAAAGLHRRRVVVVAQRAVRGEADRRRLPATVHRHEVDVDVDDEVGLRRPLADLDLLAVVGGADEADTVGILGVELVQRPDRLEGVVDPIADGVAQLGLGHPAVQGEGGDEVDVVDSGLGGEVEDRLDDPLADVGTAHLRQRQADVVEGDRQLHPGEQQGAQRLGVDRVVEGVVNRSGDVVDRRQRLRGVDDPAAVGRQLLEGEALAAPEQRRRCRAVDVEHESGARHQRVLLSRSKTILMAPRRPASAAWAMASAWSARRYVADTHRSASMASAVSAARSNVFASCRRGAARCRRCRRRRARSRGATVR